MPLLEAETQRDAESPVFIERRRDRSRALGQRFVDVIGPLEAPLVSAIGTHGEEPHLIREAVGWPDEHLQVRGATVRLWRNPERGVERAQPAGNSRKRTCPRMTGPLRVFESSVVPTTGTICKGSPMGVLSAARGWPSTAVYSTLRSHAVAHPPDTANSARPPKLSRFSNSLAKTASGFNSRRETMMVTSVGSTESGIHSVCVNDSGFFRTACTVVRAASISFAALTAASRFAASFSVSLVAPATSSRYRSASARHAASLSACATTSARSPVRRRKRSSAFCTGFGENVKSFTSDMNVIEDSYQRLTGHPGVRERLGCGLERSLRFLHEVPRRIPDRDNVRESGSHCRSSFVEVRGQTAESRRHGRRDTERGWLRGDRDFTCLCRIETHTKEREKIGGRRARHRRRLNRHAVLVQVGIAVDQHHPHLFLLAIARSAGPSVAFPRIDDVVLSIWDGCGPADSLRRIPCGRDCRQDDNRRHRGEMLSYESHRILLDAVGCCGAAAFLISVDGQIKDLPGYRTKTDSRIDGRDPNQFRFETR